MQYYERENSMKYFLRRKTLFGVVLAVLLVLPTLLTLKIYAAAQPLLDQTAYFVSGREYIIATASEITDNQSQSIAHCALLGEEIEDVNGLNYAAIPDTDVADKFLWKITDEGNGKYSLYSASLEKYMKLENKKIVMTEEKSTVNAVFSGGHVYFCNDEGQYLRFTNGSSVSRFHCSSTNVLYFKLYAFADLPEEYAESEEPLLSVACFSDMHQDRKSVV